MIYIAIEHIPYHLLVRDTGLYEIGPLVFPTHEEKTFSVYRYVDYYQMLSIQIQHPMLE